MLRWVGKLLVVVVLNGVLGSTSSADTIVSVGPDANAVMVIKIRDSSQAESAAQPARLIGYGDYGMLCEHTFDQASFFQTLQGYGINLVRVWIIYHWDEDYLPFGKTRDKKSNVKKWDLLKPSTPFFTRVAKFVADADAAGFIVQLCLFDENAFDKTTGRWANSPYNDSNNAADTTFIPDNSANPISKFLVTSSGKKKTIWDVNQMVIDQTVAAVGKHGNVIYEVMNEPDTKLAHNDQHALTNFHAHVIAEIRSVSPNAIVSVNLANTTDTFGKWALSPDCGVKIVSFHLPPDGTPNDLPGTSGKPVIVSNDGHDTQSNLNLADMRQDYAKLIKAHPKADPRSLGALILLSDVFDAKNLVAGTRHFEFLDKDLMKKDHQIIDNNGKKHFAPIPKVTNKMDTTWLTDNYLPRATCFDTDILKTLGGFTVN